MKAFWLTVDFTKGQQQQQQQEGGNIEALSQILRRAEIEFRFLSFRVFRCIIAQGHIR